ncbi:hypothetical protein [Methylocapsa palsarum]|nr:hypothetical protein [Methylocapsa palsarum]
MLRLHFFTVTVAVTGHVEHGRRKEIQSLGHVFHRVNGRRKSRMS